VACVTSAEQAIRAKRRLKRQELDVHESQKASESRYTKIAVGDIKYGQLYANFLRKHQAALRTCGLSVTALRPAPLYTSLVAKFLSLAKKNPSFDLVFHGTAKTNFDSIFENGFLLPGHKGVRVTNGTSYGAGIYSTIDPVFASGYCAGHNELLVCALANDRKVVRVPDQCTHMRIAASEGYILPLFVMQYSHGYNTPATKSAADAVGNLLYSFDLAARASRASSEPARDEISI